MIRLRTGCKINLGLAITGKRPDGFHDLESLFYPLPLPCDDLLLRIESGRGLQLAGTCKIPARDNLLAKAYAAFAKSGGNAPGLRVQLIKRVPVGSGLGGGSANAAAFLQWLNANSATPLSQQKLEELGAELGADIPFFFLNRPCQASGKGEKLEPVPFAGAGMFLVLACPNLPISTAWAFASFDRTAAAGNLTNMASIAKNANSIGFCVGSATGLRNDLEDVVFAAHPQLQFLKQRLMESGACHAAMSGSGSAIYGIFDNPEASSAAAVGLRADGVAAYRLPMRNFGV